MKVVESQTEESHDSFALRVWHILEELLLRRNGRRINTTRNIV